MILEETLLLIYPITLKIKIKLHFMSLKPMKLFQFLFFLLLTNISYSQVEITGYIEESGSGERLPYSNVYLVDLELGASANENGFFSFKGEVKPGMILKASYVGYQTKTIELTQEIIDSQLVISLLPLTSTLNEVVISTESSKFLQSSSEISAHRISVQQLSLMPSIGEVDIFRSLQLLPGVSATQESSSGLYIRGGQPQENLVLLDGIKVYNVDHFFGFFSAFNANAIKSVDLYKGAFPSKYGGRLSTVIEIPFIFNLSDAFKHSCNLAPKFNKATFLPSLTTFPFPISNTSLILGNSTPIPLPLGYLNAEGLSFIFTAVFIILTSSASSLAAITTKFGKVER